MTIDTLCLSLFGGIAPDPGFIYGVATKVMRALIYLGPG